MVSIDVPDFFTGSCINRDQSAVEGAHIDFALDRRLPVDCSTTTGQLHELSVSLWVVCQISLPVLASARRRAQPLKRT